MVMREVIVALCLPCAGRKRTRVGDRSDANTAPLQSGTSCMRRSRANHGAPVGRKEKAQSGKDVFVIGELEDSPGVVRRRWARIIGNYEKRKAAEAAATAAAAAAAASKSETTDNADHQALVQLPGSVPDGDPRGSDGGSFRSSCDDVLLGGWRRPDSNISRGSWKTICSCKHGENQGNMNVSQRSCIFCRHNSNESRRTSASTYRSCESNSTNSRRDVGSNDVAPKSCILCRVRSTESSRNAIRTSNIWDCDNTFSYKDGELTGRFGSAHSSCIFCDVASSASRSVESFCSCCDGDYFGSFESSCSSDGGYSSSGNSGSNDSLTNDRKPSSDRRRFSLFRRSNRVAVADTRCSKIKNSCIATAL